MAYFVCGGASASKMESLGSGTRFDIKALYPNDYNRLTNENFFVEIKKINVSASGSGGYELPGNYATDEHTESASGSNSLNITPSYDDRTGILTINGLSTSTSPAARNTYGSVTAFVNINATASCDINVWIKL